MTLLQRRISDPRALKLIEGWLEAGVMVEGEYIEPDGLGTSQGGVISSLLPNIYLYSFDKMFQMSGISGTLVRYCDYFLILLGRDGKGVLEKVRQMAGRLGLHLPRDKTRVGHAREGFDFLGAHFCRSRLLGGHPESRFFLPVRLFNQRNKSNGECTGGKAAVIADLYLGNR